MYIALVVEDNASLNRLYAKVLMQVGLTVYQALSCQQAFNHLSDIVPNIIFLDMGLPDGNGIAIAEYVRFAARINLLRHGLSGSQVQNTTSGSTTKRYSTSICIHPSRRLPLGIA